MVPGGECTVIVGRRVSIDAGERVRGGGIYGWMFGPFDVLADPRNASTLQMDESLFFFAKGGKGKS